MTAIEQLITDNLDIWTSAIKTRSSAGRGSSNKIELYGVKKLRELILELAAQGFLVPQEPSDEPASELIKKVKSEQKQLSEEGKIKKVKPLPAITEQEKPTKLRQGWIAVRLGELFNAINSGGTPSKSNPDFWNGNIPWASVKDLGSERYIHDTQDHISQSGLENGSRLADVDDILICTRMGLGKISIVKNAMAFNQDLKAVKLSRYCNVDFFLNTYSTLNIKGTGTTVAGIKQDQLVNYIIGLPPINEQHRIVAKVDELMTLCDQLEQQTESSLTAHQTLVETLLGALTNAPDHDSFQQAWQRIAEHFDTLFTTEHSIDQLKQTILQLAVMGKLVPQDPNDEPASELLKRIAAEKAKLIKEGKIKKQKPLPPISDEEKPFELPKGWEWCRFEDIVDIQSGITKGRKLAGRKIITVPYLSVANVQRSYLDLSNVKEVDIPIEEREKYEVLKGDLLITEGGDWDKVGRTAIWQGGLDYVAHQNHVFKARVILPSQNEEWLEKWLNSPFSRDYFAGSSKQTTNLASINKTQLRACLIAVPPKIQKETILLKLNEMINLCSELKSQISNEQVIKLTLSNVISEHALS